jgi:hypothetical protein
VIDEINENKREFERKQQLMQVQQRLVGRPTGLAIIVPNRRLLREGPMTIQAGKRNKRQALYVFLFNDLIIIAQGKTPQFLRFKRVLSLDLTIENNVDGMLPSTHCLSRALSLARSQLVRVSRC